MDNIQVNGQRLSMSYTAEWKVCCGLTASQSWQDICQDACPFHSGLAIVALKDADILCSGATEYFAFPCNVTFPCAQDSSLTHSQSFASSNALSKKLWMLRSKISYYLQLNSKVSLTFMSQNKELF